MTENKVIWHPIEEGYPLESDEYLSYLVTLKHLKFRHVGVAAYSDDLYKLDKHDFSDLKNLPKEKRKGFFGYDSEFGFYKRDDIIAWAYLPEPYEDTQDGEED